MFASSWWTSNSTPLMRPDWRRIGAAAFLRLSATALFARSSGARAITFSPTMLGAIRNSISRAPSRIRSFISRCIVAYMCPSRFRATSSAPSHVQATGPVSTPWKISKAPA
ncbi:hypothetical protein RHSP_82546 [Rhizobium freirei PRF 81]|uniref:Uncharacterized protein n=1 Tax=Rhizobium freirei PRF 81 TaxID=363754 RepID=N6U5R0_9HYPH|nr:hypothetical protein RHSP_82546 [Rhizobium freirei PRF 81]